MGIDIDASDVSLSARHSFGIWMELYSEIEEELTVGL